jgi:hypothetical protein
MHTFRYDCTEFHSGAAGVEEVGEAFVGAGKGIGG